MIAINHFLYLGYLCASLFCYDNIYVSDMISSVDKNKVPSDSIILGAGCFWCVEAVYNELEGVVSVENGYCGGHLDNPSYEEVCTGRTGHAEVCKIIYNPALLPLDSILEIYWHIHDPTTPNRQGSDIGTQYRSVIFYFNQDQKETAEAYIKKLNDTGVWDAPVITSVEPCTHFYPAEAYHQDYFAKHPDQAYCRMVIQPKVEKFRKVFHSIIKD